MLINLLSDCNCPRIFLYMNHQFPQFSRNHPLQILPTISQPKIRVRVSISKTKSSMAANSNGNGNGNGNGNPNPKPALRKPTFIKVDKLKPGTSGLNLTVKVLDSSPVVKNGRSNFRNPPRIAECLVGDESGVILFTARNDQVDIMKPGTTVILRNAKIDMFKGTMRLAVDKWGRIEVTEPGSFTVKDDNNLSLVEYELVNVSEGGQ